MPDARRSDFPGPVPVPVPGPIPIAEPMLIVEEPPFPVPDPGFPSDPLWYCHIDLPQGCYRISLEDPFKGINYYGTMRVEYTGSQITMSGDLYRFPLVIVGAWEDLGLRSRTGDIAGPADTPSEIPIYPRDRSYSYLKVTNIEKGPHFKSV